MRAKLYAGAKIRRLRESHGLTQFAFAERIGVSASYLNQIENNQRPLTAAVPVSYTHLDVYKRQGGGLT